MGVSDTAVELLQGLLVQDPRRRLGGGYEGSLAIQGHAWFQSLDFAALFDKQVAPPYVPEVEGEADTRFFDIDEQGDGGLASMESLASPAASGHAPLSHDPTSNHSLYSNFDGFSYYRPGSLQSNEWLHH